MRKGARRTNRRAPANFVRSLSDHTHIFLYDATTASPSAPAFLSQSAVS
jgi:hypothetical protein